MEAADQEYLGDLPSKLISTENLDVAKPIFWISIALFALTAGVLFVRFLIRLGRPTEASSAGDLTATPERTRSRAASAARGRRLRAGSLLRRRRPDPGPRPRRGARYDAGMPDIEFAFLADAAQARPG